MKVYISDHVSDYIIMYDPEEVMISIVFDDSEEHLMHATNLRDMAPECLSYATYPDSWSEELALSFIKRIRNIEAS